MQGSHPERRLHSPDPQPKATPAAASSSGTLLLRICWLLLGSAFVLVFGFILFVVLFKGPNVPATAPVEQTIATKETEAPPKTDDNAEHELLPTAPKPATNDRRPDGVERVLGNSFHPSRPDDAPPPLPPPPLKSQPATLPQASPQLPAVPKTKDADAAFEGRLQASAEDLRKQLQDVTELRLFSDLVVQNFRAKEQNDERTMKGVPRDQIDFAYNAQLNKYMRQAGLKEGLPLLSGPKCQLDPETASIVQTLSKDLRDMGLVSVPGAARRRNGSPKEKLEAFQQWCDVNTVEKFRGALATLLQVLQVEDAPMRLLLVRELAKAQGPEATAALAKRAMVDLSPEVRQSAAAALEKRAPQQYAPVLLQGLRYPWPPVADHAALALRKLKPQGVVPRLIDLLDKPNPSMPVLDPLTKKPMVRELVRLNHMRHCLLCHAPSASDKDGLVRGLVPTPGQPLPRLYYAGQKGNYARADMTFMRQDFSVNLPMIAAAPWPNEQRYDFVTRVRPAKPEEMVETTSKPGNYPQRDAVLYALRGLTGKDGGDSSDQWRKSLGMAVRAAEKKNDAPLDKPHTPPKD